LQREVYLQRFIESDSRRFLQRFYKDYKGLNGDQAMAVLVDHTEPVPKQLTTVFLSIHPADRVETGEVRLASTSIGLTTVLSTAAVPSGASAPLLPGERVAVDCPRGPP
jgi:hypothetical protein